MNDIVTFCSQNEEWGMGNSKLKLKMGNEEI